MAINFDFEKWEKEAERINNITDSRKKEMECDDFCSDVLVALTDFHDNNSYLPTSLKAFAMSEENTDVNECVRAFKLIYSLISIGDGYNMNTDYLFEIQQLLIKRILKSVGYSEVAAIINPKVFPRDM